MTKPSKNQDAPTTAKKKPQTTEPQTNFPRKISELEQQLEQAKAAQLRAVADLENWRRRTATQQGQWQQAAVQSFCSPWLGSLQELILAQEHSQDASTVALIEKLLKNLEQAGLKTIHPDAGEALDPHRHEVLLSEEGTAGTVVRTLQVGWEYQQQVLQPAKVSAAQVG